MKMEVALRCVRVRYDWWVSTSVVVGKHFAARLIVCGRAVVPRCLFDTMRVQKMR